MLILRQTDRISIASQWVIALIAFQLLQFSPSPIKAQLLLAGFHCTFPGKFKNKLLYVFNILTPLQCQCHRHPCPHWVPPGPAGPAEPGPDGHEVVPQHCRTDTHGQTDTGTLGDTRGHSDTHGHGQTHTTGPADTQRHRDTLTQTLRLHPRVCTTLALPGEHTPYLSPLGGQRCWDFVPHLHRS